ncbi:hypothetical protein [Parerythrobacter aestuarii]|uniref:hypothetical protein n=1 Tax=Parerythrobacter aestuarii TaxID=3020909 RepID=UPI0024DE5C83|nr:hypothetical protein [Parerythrobacter aestuarii]
MASVSQGRFREDERRRDADHVSFLKHRRWRWLKIATALCVVAFLSYALVDVEPRHNGGSWYGYTLGTIGLLLIVWLSLLGIRKRNITEGRWSLKAWTSAHVYLGLALIVIGTLHTGFQLGWNVHTLAWALMIIVIISGIYGVTAYALLPTQLSSNRKEMTRAQMVEALAAIDRQLEQAAQPLERDQTDLVIAALDQDTFAHSAWARLTGRYPRCATTHALEALPENYRLQGDGADPLDRVRALLRRRAAQLGQIRRQLRTKALLEVWLFVHVPATIALLAALTAHVVSVFYYW